MYWFVRVKFVNDDDMSYFNNLIDDVFIAENREKAKEHCIKTYGNYPFRKTKDLKNGDKYFYLTESNEYWWDYHNKPITLKCNYCEKTVEVIGEKNNSGFCSDECKENHYKKLHDLKYGEGGWVDKDQHIEEKNGMPYGYIYKITNKRTMKCYIGQTINVPIFRWWQHLKVDCKFEQESLIDLVFEVIDIVYQIKYLPNFHCIDDIKSEKQMQEELNILEGKYIKQFDSVNEGYNIIQPSLEQQQSLF